MYVPRKRCWRSFLESFSSPSFRCPTLLYSVNPRALEHVHRLRGGGRARPDKKSLGDWYRLRPTLKLTSFDGPLTKETSTKIGRSPSPSPQINLSGLARPPPRTRCTCSSARGFTAYRSVRHRNEGELKASRKERHPHVRGTYTNI